MEVQRILIRAVYMCESPGFVVQIACSHASATDLDSRGIDVRLCRGLCSSKSGLGRSQTGLRVATGRVYDVDRAGLTC